MILDNICILLIIIMISGCCILSINTEYEYDVYYDTNGNKINQSDTDLTVSNESQPNSESTSLNGNLINNESTKDSTKSNKNEQGKNNEKKCPVCRSDIDYNIFKDKSSNKPTDLPWDYDLNDCKIKKSNLEDRDLYPNFSNGKNVIVMA